MFKLLNAESSVGAVGKPVRIGTRFTNHSCRVTFKDIGATKISALTVVLQGANLKPAIETGLITSPVLQIGSTPENVRNDQFYYEIAGTRYSKAQVLAGTALEAGYDITTAKYGVINIYIDSAGTLSYGYPAVVQAYATMALAIAAGDALLTTLIAGKCYIGRILLYNNTGATWDSVTDDLTDGSNITNAVFVNEPVQFTPLKTHAFTGAELIAQEATFMVPDASFEYVRGFMASKTGEGEVTFEYTPIGGN